MGRKIAPRLKNGDSRVNYGGRLPNEIKEYIQWYARKDMSWVMEQIIIDYFELVAPKYIDDKSVKQRYLRVIRRRA